MDTEASDLSKAVFGGETVGVKTARSPVAEQQLSEGPGGQGQFPWEG